MYFYAVFYGIFFSYFENSKPELLFDLWKDLCHTCKALRNASLEFPPTLLKSLIALLP